MDSGFKNQDSRINRKGVLRAFRYLAVGVSTFLFDLLILYALTSFFHVHYLYAVAIGFIVGVSLNYFISRTWVFKGTLQPLHHGYVYFIGAGSVSLIVILTLVNVLVGAFHIPLLVSRVIVSGLVGMGNYLFNLYLNFKVAGKHYTSH